MKLSYIIIMNQEPDGKYTVTVPALPGCITFGNSPEHAIEMAKVAIELYIEELKERNEKIPDNRNTIVHSINIEPA